MTLIFLSYPDSPERTLAARWLREFRSSARLNWMATMAAMFGTRWLQSEDEKVLAMRSVSESDSVPSGENPDGLWATFLLVMIGQVPLDSLIDLVRSNLDLWDQEILRISALPGSSRLIDDIRLILSGQHDRVSWNSSPSTKMSSEVSGVNDRVLRGLRRGDAVLADPSSRHMSLSELLRRCRAIAARNTDDRRLYTVDTVEFPDPEQYCVVVRRAR